MEDTPILKDGQVVTTTSVPLADYLNQLNAEIAAIEADTAQRMSFISDAQGDIDANTEKINAKNALIKSLNPQAQS